ncbi:NUMOD4 motif protein [compost metagenome]
MTWKKIVYKDIEDYYSVNEFGDVRHDGKNKILHKKVTTTGYHAVSLKTKKRGRQWILVHQLVARRFVDRPLVVTTEIVPDHLDGNKLNNYYKNLKWRTRGDNIREAHKMGLINNKGENNKNAIVDDETVHKICGLLEEGCRYDDIIEKLNLSDTKQIRTLLVRIKNRNKWVHISKGYNFDDKSYIPNNKQQEVIDKIPLILQLIADGFRDPEIVDAIWGRDIPNRKSKCMTISNIRHKKVFKKFL